MKTCLWPASVTFLTVSVPSHGVPAYSGLIFLWSLTVGMSVFSASPVVHIHADHESSDGQVSCFPTPSYSLWPSGFCRTPALPSNPKSLHGQGPGMVAAVVQQHLEGHMSPTPPLLNGIQRALLVACLFISNPLLPHFPNLAGTAPLQPPTPCFQYSAETTEFPSFLFQSFSVSGVFYSLFYDLVGNLTLVV